ncbi:MAG: hypothetical protein NZM25_04980 [Leptospiraceae bacterium]|nr:hypothetical protein [Leptospiraceae bacterium]MDW8305636.1 hypothetical protein [Leptospiraceae bacterium]
MFFLAWPVLAAIILLACQGTKTIYLRENLILAKAYTEPSKKDIEHKSREFARPVALYLFYYGKWQEQAQYILEGRYREALSYTEEHYAARNNRAIACFFLGDYRCAESELLLAALSENKKILHNLRVVHKWQQKDIKIVKSF